MVTPRSRTTLLGFATSLLGLPLAAQNMFGSDVIVTNYNSPVTAVYRVSPSQVITPITLGVAIQGVSGLVATRRGEVVVCDSNSGNVLLVPRNGNATILTNIPGCFRAGEDIDGEFLITSFQSRTINRVTRTGQVTPIVTLTAPARPNDVTVDENGDYIYCDDTGSPRGVFRVNRTTRVITPIHTGAPLSLPQGLALFANGDIAVIDGIVDAVFRIDRLTQGITTFVPNSVLGNNPDGITESHDGGFYAALSSTSGNQVVGIDRLGNLTPYVSGAPFTNLEDVTVVRELTGPTNLTSGAGSTFAFGLELPRQPTKPYTVALAGGLFPGIPFPFGDARALAINGDPLFVSTFFQNLSPVLVGFTGVTNPSGIANLTFDLSFFPPGTFAGLKLFAQGLTLDPTAATGIGAVSNPLRLDLR